MLSSSILTVGVLLHLCQLSDASSLHNSYTTLLKGKVLTYSLPSVGHGADPGVQEVSPQLT